MRWIDRPSGDSAAIRTFVRVRGTGRTCRECGAALVERETRDGRKLLGCFWFPECKGGALLITRRARSLERRGPVLKTRVQRAVVLQSRDVKPEVHK